MMGLKLNHVSERCPSCIEDDIIGHETCSSTKELGMLCDTLDI